MPAAQTQYLNGISLGLLAEYGSAMQAARDGTVSARLRHRWLTGFAVEGEGLALDTAGTSAPRTQHGFRTDWPAPFSDDSGPTPGLELLLAAAAACALTTCAAKAAARGIELETMEAHTSGSVDLRGLFESDPTTPAGLSRIDVALYVRTPAGDDQLATLRDDVLRTSPVLSTLAAATSLQVNLQRMEAP